ncbi:thioredoxin family protein [Infirmifilum sp. NZ]|uniref:thioredoxin family protein n=1 Tax=Infirmifilum sp. NZ TaxID=2926850 RepID=UPI0027997CE4|nr:thioredoxin family protein [Infirmifilum sp. NZ]UNQ72807.1 hypothetical protein MOV14_06735 [Infirmifilum sp. NZ]
MAKEIKVFLPRDPKAQEMLEAFKAEMNAMPKGERPRLVVRLLSLKDPSKFEEWLQSLEEVFGGIYVAEFKKYGIKAVPAVVVDNEKVVEGKYLSRQEIKLLVRGLSPELASIPPLEAPREELQPVEVPREEPPVKPVQPQQVTPKKKVETPPPIELAPVEVPESPEPTRLEEPKVKQAPPAPQTKPQPQQPPQYPKPQPVERTVRAEEKAPVKVQPVAPQPSPREEGVAGTCFTCLFYDQARGRCRLLHVAVPDPNNPPCGRRRPRQ